MAINKVIDRNNSVLIDLTNDTVSPNKVLVGTKFHGPDGQEYNGALSPNEVDKLKYSFIDYDGTLMYSFSDEELDALTELPAGPDHTADNLTFQEWNWTLEDLKAWDRTRPDRPIVGATLITTDKKSYIYLDIPYSGKTLSISISGTYSIDWGDGTVDTTNSHTFTNPGQYNVVIDLSEGGYWEFRYSSNAMYYVKNIKIGYNDRIYLTDIFKCEKINLPNTIVSWDRLYGAYYLRGLVIPKSLNSTYTYGISYAGFETVSIPNGFKELGQQSFAYCYLLKNIVLPETLTSMTTSCFQSCHSLKSIYIPKNITSIGDSTFRSCSSLESISGLEGVKTIRPYSFQSCSSLRSIEMKSLTTISGYNIFSSCESLEYIEIPDSVTTFSASSIFSSCNKLTLDLSKQSKLLTLTSSPSLNKAYNKILVPLVLLNEYKTASYWSEYASIMVGV